MLKTFRYWQSKLNFDAHVDDVFKKAGQILYALSRVTTYMDLSKIEVYW